MNCGISNGRCRWAREAVYWKRAAAYFMALSVVNFCLAWAIALYRVFGGVR